MIPEMIKKASLPHKPGIYIFLDGTGNILYVGKAIDLYHRVSSYFRAETDSIKTKILVEKIRSVRTIVVESELEALVLEANLIKRYLPPYNIRLTDDKDYLYIKLTKENLPKVVTARKKELEGAKKYFGPYPSSTTVRTTLKKLRKVFPWCQMGDKQGKACFYYHLGLCPGSCVGKIDKKNYNRIINNLALFLEGKKTQLLGNLVKEMEDLSKNMQYEKAQEIKKTIEGLNYLTQPNRVANYLQNPNFLEEENLRAIEELQRVLRLPGLPEKVEGYDISNIQGRQASGSMVVLTNGEIDKSQYRKFKIRISGKPNDYAMHKEMMGRRLNHPEWPLPQLIIIDGGRGQVRAVKEELDKRKIVIPIYGLAKRMEWLYPPEGEIVKLAKRSLSLRVLQRLRDESHRFALAYHRKLRANSVGLTDSSGDRI